MVELDRKTISITTYTSEKSANFSLSSERSFPRHSTSNFNNLR